MKLTERQKNIRNTVWLYCPNCHKSWRGIDFTTLYEGQIREGNKDLAEDEIKRRARKAAKAQRMTGQQPMLAQIMDTDTYCCPFCGQTYEYDEIVALLHQNRVPIALAKIITAIIKPFISITKLFKR